MKNKKPAWNKGRTGVYSQETLKKMSETKRGKVFSEKHLKNLSVSHLGQKAWNKGIPLTAETKKKLSESLTGKKRIWSEERKKSFKEKMSGSNNPAWVPDRTKLQRYSDDAMDRRSSAYNYWRKQVWERDLYRCKIEDTNCEGRLEAHHIMGWKEFPELRYDVNNGITLCHAHHPKKRAEEKRLVSYFQKLVSVPKD